MPPEDTESVAISADESTVKLFACGTLPMSSIKHLLGCAWVSTSCCPKFAYRSHTIKKRNLRLLTEFITTQLLRGFSAMLMSKKGQQKVSPVNMIRVRRSTGHVYVDLLNIKYLIPHFLADSPILPFKNRVDLTAHTNVALKIWCPII